MGDNTDQYYNVYQQGYAKSFWEHFGGNISISHKIFNYKFIRFGFMANFLVDYESRLIKDYFYYTDPQTGATEYIEEEYYLKPSFVGELTVGPSLDIKLHSKFDLYSSVGLGVIYLNHSRWGTSRILNSPVYVGTLGVTENWNRGDIELVGVDGLPMISFGVKYRFK